MLVGSVKRTTNPYSQDSRDKPLETQDNQILTGTYIAYKTDMLRNKSSYILNNAVI